MLEKIYKFGDDLDWLLESIWYGVIKLDYWVFGDVWYSWECEKVFDW